jgi:amino acid adenylation domain-containing protein
LLVDAFLEHSARHLPDKVALVCGDRRLTYSEVDATVDRFASGLRALGVSRGDRVAIYLDNSIEAVLSVFAILRAGAIFVPIGSTVKADKLAYILTDSEAVALITDQRASTAVVEAVRRCAHTRTVVMVGCSNDGREIEGMSVVSYSSVLERGATLPTVTRQVIDIDLAALIYTSGSTGRPKGVMLTHLNIVAAATSIGGYLENTSDDVILNVLPLSFDYGLYQVFLAFKAGARLVLEPSFVYTTLLIDVLVREGVTGLPIVPMMAVLLMKHDLSALQRTLRYITSTGSALPPAHITALRARFPTARIYSMYGLTECKRVSFLPPEDLDERLTSVGKPMDNVEVFVADEHGQLHESGIGELVIRGANVMQGYWRAPEETARVLKPGKLPGQSLLYSGDLFRIDEDGYMHFMARLDDMIKSRGQRVSPKEVENVIYELPGVCAVSVVGVPDATQGNFVKAFVHVDDEAGLSEQDVLRHCAKRLEDFMVPKVVEFVSSAPTTDSGKLHRRQMASQGGQSQSQSPSPF